MENRLVSATLPAGLLAGAFLLVLLAGCAAIEVSHDYDTGRDFSGLKTYAWVARPAGQEPETLDEQRIRVAVDRALSLRGFTPAASNPDFRVAAHVAKQQKVDVQDWGYRGRPYGGARGRARLEVTEYEEGTLVLDIVDPETNTMMWRGTARARLDRKPPPPEERARRIDDAVNRILQAFPPR